MRTLNVEMLIDDLVANRAPLRLCWGGSDSLMDSVV